MFPHTHHTHTHAHLTVTLRRRQHPRILDSLRLTGHWLLGASRPARVHPRDTARSAGSADASDGPGSRDRAAAARFVHAVVARSWAVLALARRSPRPAAVHPRASVCYVRSRVCRATYPHSAGAAPGRRVGSLARCECFFPGRRPLRPHSRPAAGPTASLCSTLYPPPPLGALSSSRMSILCRCTFCSGIFGSFQVHHMCKDTTRTHTLSLAPGNVLCAEYAEDGSRARGELRALRNILQDAGPSSLERPSLTWRRRVDFLGANSSPHSREPADICRSVSELAGSAELGSTPRR
jgi:hypothetical protein